MTEQSRVPKALESTTLRNARANPNQRKTKAMPSLRPSNQAQVNLWLTRQRRSGEHQFVTIKDAGQIPRLIYASRHCRAIQLVYNDKYSKYETPEPTGEEYQFPPETFLLHDNTIVIPVPRVSPSPIIITVPPNVAVMFLNSNKGEPINASISPERRESNISNERSEEWVNEQ